MLQRRYPHAAAGRLAVGPFGAAGLIAGWVASDLIHDGPTLAVSAIFWSALSAAVAFLVFSSEGPTRPTSLLQAAIADGVVVGILAGVTGTLFEVLPADAAGGSGSTVTGIGVVGAVAAGAGIGALAGGALGAVVRLLARTRQLERPAPAPSGRKRAGSRKRKHKRP